MTLSGKKVGFALTGSFCTISKAMPQIKKLIEQGAIITPIMSEMLYNNDTRFGKADEIISKLNEICSSPIINSIIDAEPIGPKDLFDILIIAPCTGNTLTKIVLGITDATVPMACKAHIRNEKPVVIAIATNDALGCNAKNLGQLLNTKNFYFVPFNQDNPFLKPHSIVADFNQLIQTTEYALDNKQLQPIISDRK